MLGGKFFIDNNLKNREPNRQLGIGDKVNYYNLGYVMWLGGFAQAEIVKPQYSAFGSVSGKNQLAAFCSGERESRF